jgi:hypothetical protein
LEAEVNLQGVDPCAVQTVPYLSRNPPFEIVHFMLRLNRKGSRIPGFKRTPNA